MCWFNFDLCLNTGLVAIIGNKGSGKSALSDIVGQVCKCKTMGSASFLNSNRFRKLPKNFAGDYIVKIKWKDGHIEEKSLDDIEYGTVIEDAQYLPQKYIEEVCNDIGNVFQEEIDKVIYSYVDRTERGNAINLEELVVNKSQDINTEILSIKNDINKLNEKIIYLEKKKTSQYQAFIYDSMEKYEEILERHKKNKPQEVMKPEQKEENIEYQNNLKEINLEIDTLENQIKKNKDDITKINIAIIETQQILVKLKTLREEFDNIGESLHTYFEKYHLEERDHNFELKIPDDIILEYKNKLNNAKNLKQIILNGNSLEKGLIQKLEDAKGKREKIILNTDVEEKKYQKYLNDIREWENEKNRIIGDKDTEGCLEYFRNEKIYLEQNLDNEYQAIRRERDSKFRKLFESKNKLISIYQEIYAPIESEITKLLGELEDNIEFEAEMQLIQEDFSERVLSLISQRYAGIFKGKVEANNKMTKLLRNTDFTNENSILNLVNNIIIAVDEDMDNSEKKISDKSEFYNYLYGLEYIGVSFKLKMSGRNLEELSPGERGIVLLIFYLALNKNNMPIIIDQPEDNLDNQSVYNKLVPCICAAKQRRQVIIVTHNPNIAVACDAEQIICCEMDKKNYSITYTSGAIEDGKIKKYVVDILEGTMPAFDLRRRKYV